MITTAPHRYEQTFAEVKRFSYAGLDGPELLRRTAERLALSVPFEAYCASTVDPATNLITHGLAEGMGEDEEQGAFYLDHIYFEEDLGQLVAMLQERRSVQLLSETTGGRLDRSLRYRELLEPSGFGHELGVAFTDGGNLWGGMDLIREAGDPDFGERETNLMRRIAPHLGVGLKAATLRSQTTVGEKAGDAPGVLTLDRFGRVVSHTPAAERWLWDLEDLRPTWREGALPMAVRMVANAVRRSLSPAASGDEDLVPRLRVRARSGRWLSMHASLTEPADGRPSETVVVVEPARPHEVAWLNVAAYGLTAREEEVVGLVMRGLSNRQISQSLFISENTTQRHLSNIFEKVGVRSRRALLKRLFFDNLLPDMNDA